MILFFLQKFVALVIVASKPVLDRVIIDIFTMLCIITLSTVDLTRNNNLIVVGCAIRIGLRVAVVPGIFEKILELFRILFESGIVFGSVTTIALNLILCISSQ